MMFAPCTCISSNRLIMGITALRPSLRAMNSASVMLKAVCIFDAHVKGQPPYFTMYPVLDLAVLLSSWAVSALQFPLTSAFHQSSSELLLGSNTMPSDLVAVKYLPILRIAILCDVLDLRKIWCIDALHRLCRDVSIFRRNSVAQ